LQSYSMKEIITLCELTEDTLRYYEKIGLITDVERKKNNHRLYNEQHKELLIMIKCLKKTGMSLEEIRPFMSLLNRENVGSDLELKDLLRKYQERIKQKQQDLQVIWDLIDQKLDNEGPVKFGPFS